MEVNPQKKEFLDLFQEVTSQGQFVKLTLSKVFKAQEDLKNTM